jgi:hypothetical protein
LTGALCAPYQFMGALLLCSSSRWPTDSGSKKKEPGYTCLNEAKAPHSQRMWAEVSSSASHLLHNGLSDSPIRWRCLLRVLCAMRRPVTALDCVLLKDRNLALAPRQCSEINCRACLWVSPRPRRHTQCWFTNQLLILFRISYPETPKAGSGPTNFRAEQSLASLSAISFLHTPACPGTQYSPTTCRLLALLDQWRCCFDGPEQLVHILWLMNPVHLCLDLTSCLLSSGFPTKALCSMCAMTISYPASSRPNSLVQNTTLKLHTRQYF